MNGLFLAFAHGRQTTKRHVPYGISSKIVPFFSVAWDVPRPLPCGRTRDQIFLPNPIVNRTLAWRSEQTWTSVAGSWRTYKMGEETIESYPLIDIPCHSSTQRQSLLGLAETQFFLHFTSHQCYRTALRTLEESVFQISPPFFLSPILQPS